MNNPQRTLWALAELAGHLAADWPAYLTVEANLARPTLAATSTEPTSRGSDTPDPTHAVTASHIRYWSTVDDLDIALMHLRSAQSTMGSVRRHHSEIAAEHDTTSRAIRCSGAIDATCTDNAVRDGLCWRCYQKRRRYGTEAAQRRTP